MKNFTKKFQLEIIITLFLSLILYIFKFYPNVDEYEHIYEYKFNEFILLDDYIEKTQLDEMYQIINDSKSLILRYLPKSLLKENDHIIKKFSNSFYRIAIFDYNHHKAYRPIYNFVSQFKKDNFNLVLINYQTELSEDIRIRLYVNSPNKNTLELKKNIDDFENNLFLFFNKSINNNILTNIKDFKDFGDNVLFENNLLLNDIILRESIMKQFEIVINELEDMVHDFKYNDASYFYGKTIVNKNKNNIYNHFLLTFIFFLILIFIRKKTNKVD